LDLEYNTYNSTNILHAFGSLCGVRADNNKMTIPHTCGEGFMHSFNFNSGISVLVSDISMKEDLEIRRNQHQSSQYFVLLFNELVEQANIDHTEKFAFDKFDLRKKIVRLSSSLIPSQSILPANFRVRSVLIIFNKQSLLSFIDFKTAEEFINLYFSIYIKKSFLAPMSAEYRWIIEELHHEIAKHPLQNLFVENRMMLLLEKFLYNFMVREKHTGKKLQFKEEELSRLVKAENMLLADFSKTAPTINVLAKACAMSPTKFKNDFKMLYGLPVYEYYQKNRMAYARTLIQHGENSIKQVGMMVGYSNLGHFAAAFKNEFDMLPSEWLQANRLHPAANEEPKPNHSL
jgi:AraC-like DNA-binding protein